MLKDLIYPERQPPQLITLIGSKTKSIFSNLLFSLEPVLDHAKVLLRRASDISGNSPVLIADAELHYSKILAHETGGAAVTQHSLDWNCNSTQPIEPNVLAHLVYAKVLFPFSTVICLFAKDFGTMEQIADILSFWLMILQSPSSRSRFTRVLILEDLNDTTCFDERLSMTNFIHKLRSCLSTKTSKLGSLGNDSISDIEFEKLLNESFFEIRILPIPRHENQINPGQLSRLKARIFQESRNAYDFRKTAQMNVSAKHFRGFIHYACRHFSQSLTTPFNFIRASRIPNPVPDFGDNIIAFHKLVPAEHFNIIPSIIASALRLDSFPPGAHSELFR